MSVKETPAVYSGKSFLGDRREYFGVTSLGVNHDFPSAKWIRCSVAIVRGSPYMDKPQAGQISISGNGGFRGYSWEWGEYTGVTGSPFCTPSMHYFQSLKTNVDIYIYTYIYMYSYTKDDDFVHICENVDSTYVRVDKLPPVTQQHIDVLVQERRNSSALSMELRLSCTNLSIC